MKRSFSEKEILKVIGTITVIVDVIGITLTTVTLKKILQRKIIKECDNVLEAYIQYYELKRGEK